jgi:putative restriction endonuclease
MKELKKYLLLFKKIRIDRSHGIAPHKPLLLLSVLQLYHSKLILDRRVFITPELVALFKANWIALVRTNHDCRISYPFYYLKSDRFWQLVPKAGFENIDQMG